MKGNRFYVSGNEALLEEKTIAIFISRKIPLNLIVPAEEFLSTIMQTSYVYIGGWHSPFEKRVLKKLTRERTKVILFTSKGIKDFTLLNYMVDSYRENRLLVCSTLLEKEKVTLSSSMKRNRILSEIADYNLFIFIDENGNLKNLFTEIKSKGKTILIFGHSANSSFFDEAIVVNNKNIRKVLND